MKLESIPINFVARAYADDAKNMAKEFNNIEKNRINWNYEPARRAIDIIYDPNISEPIVLTKFNHLKPKGAEMNKELCTALFKDPLRSEGRRFHLAPKKYLEIRHDLVISLPENFFFIRDEQIIFYWVNAWKHIKLSEVQISLFASIFKKARITEDYDIATMPIAPDIHYVAASASDKGKPRELKFRNFGNIKMLSDDELYQALQITSEAYDLHKNTNNPNRTFVELPDINPDLQSELNF